MGRKQTSKANGSCSTGEQEDYEPETEIFFNENGSHGQTEGTDQTENYAHLAGSSGPSNTNVTDQVVAASSLAQLREASQIHTERGSSVPYMFRSTPPTAHISSNENPLQSLQTQKVSSISNNDYASQAAIYSEANIRNTISGLSNALASMQQQQVGLQQQQASMEIKQDTMSGTLTNVMSLLQELTKKSQNTSQNNSAGNITPQSRGYGTSSEVYEARLSMQSAVDRAAGDQQVRERVESERTDTNMPRDTNLLAGNAIVTSENCSSNSWQNRWVGNERETSRHHFSNVGNSYRSDSIYTHGHESEDAARDAQFGRPVNPLRQSTSLRFSDDRTQASFGFNEVKLPPFNGKEDWKVWVRRFEAIAERRRWSEESKLDNLLPKLQGKAGEFVFTQLPRSTLSHYDDLIKELNSRFRVVETKKTFAAKFSQRTQRPGETAEEYAAELKRLYAKAYNFRDEKTRQEDLVRRFLDGLRDSDARFEIEYNKEPEDIDDAVYHAVNFVQTKHRGFTESSTDRKYKRYARRSKLEHDSSTDEESQDEGEDLKRVCRLPAKKENAQDKKELIKNELKNDLGKAKQTAETESLKVLTEAKDMMLKLMKQMQDIVKSNGSVTTVQQEQKPFRGRNVVCYGCSQIGHVIRECPQRNNRPIGKKPQRPARSNRSMDPGVGGSMENQNLN